MNKIWERELSHEFYYKKCHETRKITVYLVEMKKLKPLRVINCTTERIIPLNTTTAKRLISGDKKFIKLPNYLSCKHPPTLRSLGLLQDGQRVHKGCPRL